MECTCAKNPDTCDQRRYLSGVADELWEKYIDANAAMLDAQKAYKQADDRVMAHVDPYRLPNLRITGHSSV